MVTTFDRAGGAIVDARRILERAIAVDLVAPLFATVPGCVEEYRAGGVAIIGATVLHGQNLQGGAADAFRGIADICDAVARLSDRATLIESVDDIVRAKGTAKVGVLLHFQNCTPFERTLGYVELFYRLGVRVAGLTYNVRNAVGDGCNEPSDAGLSRFGRRLIREMGRIGIAVDGSHTGVRTTLDAIEASDGPFIFSHNGCKAIYEHPRNLTDEQIRACAATGGVVGILGYPWFMSADRPLKIEHVVRHIVHAADLVGTDHVAIGMDYHTSVTPYTTPEQQRAARAKMLEDGWDPRHVPEPPWSYPEGIETPAGFTNLTAALLEEGFKESDLRRILGENWIRVFGTVWRGAGRGEPSKVA